jgi:hypothetical protein
VFFENLASATAPAQQISVVDPLDSSINANTVSLGTLSLSGTVYYLGGGQHVSQTIDLRPTTDALLQIQADVDTGKRQITWEMTALDPTTLQMPSNPQVGILPPNQSPPQGEGNVTFTASANSGATTNTTIPNQATVTFDVNPPIQTNVWSNTLDNTPPVSHVLALPVDETSPSFTVSWSGTDVGSGIQNYTIYVSDNGGAFTAWQTATTQTTATFTGTTGNTYGFYSIATDNVGNVELSKTVAEASTQVTAATPVTPTVTVTPSASSITTAQALTLTVAVNGGSGNSTPTGSVTLTSGSYTSASTALSSGAATINIPSGSLPIGSDTLTVGYAPDSTSSPIYNSASGSTSVAVQGYPVITWPAPAAITYGTPLGTAQLDATASVAGSFTYVPSSGTVLNAGSQTLGVTFYPTDTTDYLTTTDSAVLQVNQAGQSISFTGLPATATYGAAGPYVLNASGGASGNPVNYGVTGFGSIIGSTLTVTGAGTVVVTANQAGNANYIAATPVSQTIIVTKATSTTVLAAASITPTQGQADLLTATVTGAGQQPGGTVVFMASATTLCTSTLSATGVANCSYVSSAIGSVTVSAQYQGDANHLASGASLTLNVGPPYDSAVHLKVHRTELVYSEVLEGEVCITSATKAPATGTVEIVDGTTLLTTRELRRDGCAHWEVRSGLSVGNHVLKAIYSGEDLNPGGTSPPVTVTISPVPVDLKILCGNDRLPYGGNFDCKVGAHSKAGPAEGSITYTFDSDTAITLPLSDGNAEFTITKPTVGNHTVVVTYAQQTNYAAAGPQVRSFMVTLAPVNVDLAMSPSRRTVKAGTSITFTVDVTSLSAGPPDATGSVSFYSGQTLLSSVAVDSKGNASYTTSSLPVGTQTIAATFSGGTYYATGSGSVTITITP